MAFIGVLTCKYTLGSYCPAGPSDAAMPHEARNIKQRSEQRVQHDRDAAYGRPASGAVPEEAIAGEAPPAGRKGSR